MFDNITADTIVALVAAFGGGAFLTEAVPGVWKWLTGRQLRERSALRKALRDLDSAEAARRRVSEHAHTLRVLLIQAGYDPNKLPQFPAYNPEEDNDDE